MTWKKIQRSVQGVVSQVIELAQPQRVVLFGSAAAGHMTPDSDLDFLVVVQDGRDLVEIVDKLNIGVRSRPLPCDFLVVTPSILRRHRSTPGLIYRDILKSGREVYAS